jgi:hypothetical protein
VSAPQWLDMATAPEAGTIALLLGETIPDHPEVVAGSYISAADARDLGDDGVGQFGGWMIWTSGEDWYCVDLLEPLGWMLLPETMPVRRRAIDNVLGLTL